MQFNEGWDVLNTIGYLSVQLSDLGRKLRYFTGGWNDADKLKRAMETLTNQDHCEAFRDLIVRSQYAALVIEPPQFLPTARRTNGTPNVDNLVLWKSNRDQRATVKTAFTGFYRDREGTFLVSQGHSLNGVYHLFFVPKDDEVRPFILHTDFSDYAVVGWANAHIPPSSPTLQSPPPPPAAVAVASATAQNVVSIHLHNNASPPASLSRLCLVCRTKPRQSVWKPCNHLCVCEECASSTFQTTKRCPRCKTEGHPERVYMEDD